MLALILTAIIVQSGCTGTLSSKADDGGAGDASVRENDGAPADLGRMEDAEHSDLTPDLPPDLAHADSATVDGPSTPPADAAASSDGIETPPPRDLGLRDSGVRDTPGDTPSDVASTETVRVAAVQYGQRAYQAVDDCDDDLCAVGALVDRAARNGARIIVTPEYAIKQRIAELAPEVGDLPADDLRWRLTGIIRPLARKADELNVLLVFNVMTKTGLDVHNTNLAIDATGRVVGRHHKFQLYGDAEDRMTPGADFESSYLSSPVGELGLLICADIHCINGRGTECSLAEMDVFERYTAHATHVVLFSAMWAVGQPSGALQKWWPLDIQQKYAQEMRTWVVAANTTEGPGRGAGIFAPDGTAVQSTTSDQPSILYADLPAS